MEYEKSKQLLLADLRKMTDPKIKLSWAMSFYTPEELIYEIENETKDGKRWIEAHVEAMKRIKKTLKKISPKKKPWWKIW